MAVLQDVARRLVPAGATDVRLQTHVPHWDPSTCDDMLPGWTNGEVDASFTMHASDTRARIVSTLTAMHWSIQKDADFPAYYRSYFPDDGSPFSAYLFEPDEGTFGWTVRVSASPAQVPSHDC